MQLLGAANRPRNGATPLENPGSSLTGPEFAGVNELTSDGKRLAFQRWAQQTTVNNADIEANGTRISSIRHLTLNEYVQCC